MAGAAARPVLDCAREALGAPGAKAGRVLGRNGFLFRRNGFPPGTQSPAVASKQKLGFREARVYPREGQGAMESHPYQILSLIHI